MVMFLANAFATKFELLVVMIILFRSRGSNHVDRRGCFWRAVTAFCLDGQHQLSSTILCAPSPITTSLALERSDAQSDCNHELDRRQPKASAGRAAADQP